MITSQLIQQHLQEVREHWHAHYIQGSGHDTINPIQARLFLPFKGPSGVFRDPLMISGTIQGNPLKLVTVIVPFKAYQNTKRNLQEYDL